MSNPPSEAGGLGRQCRRARRIRSISVASRPGRARGRPRLARPPRRRRRWKTPPPARPGRMGDERRSCTTPGGVARARLARARLPPEALDRRARSPADPARGLKSTRDRTAPRRRPDGVSLAGAINHGVEDGPARWDESTPSIGPQRGSPDRGRELGPMPGGPTAHRAAHPADDRRPRAPAGRRDLPEPQLEAHWLGLLVRRNILQGWWRTWANSDFSVRQRTRRPTALREAARLSAMPRVCRQRATSGTISSPAALVRPPALC
jgi:hypothetical protein